MQHVTTSTKITDIKREWHLIDVKGKTLGRVSTEIAKLLMGKAKPYFVRHLDCGDFVIVINAKDVATTGKKEDKKMYYRHSGYPGGFKAESLREQNIDVAQECIICVRAIQALELRERLDALSLEIEAAERARDTVRLEELMGSFREKMQELSGLLNI